MATARTAKHALMGTWRIVETELSDVEDLDLMEPAHVTPKSQGHGRLGLLAIEAALDYRVLQREGRPAIEFSFEGCDEGDDSGFTARRSERLAHRRRPRI